jgi:hypothetical protein
MATWPATLPLPTAEGYDLAPADQTVRTDMEVGAARVRRRTAARQDMLAVRWVFTDDELEDFRDWFDDATKAAGGAAWFTGLHLALGAGGLSTDAECRFVGAWQASCLGGTIWQVSARLEVR